MTFTEKNLIETYTSLFKGLSTENKIGLSESLIRLIDTENETIDLKFYNSFGAFSSPDSAEKVTADIKTSRNFRDKEIDF